MGHYEGDIPGGEIRGILHGPPSFCDLAKLKGNAPDGNNENLLCLVYIFLKNDPDPLSVPNPLLINAIMAASRLEP